jgi:hypothetical protein
MADISVSSIKEDCAVLLVEPWASQNADRETQLNEAHFCVTKAANDREIFLMHQAALPFVFAILSDTLGGVALRNIADTVRQQWPFARILILGKVPVLLADHLYDEAVAHTLDQRSFLATLEELAKDPWNLRSRASAQHFERAGLDTRSLRGATLESDPTKVPVPMMTAEYGRHRPSSEQSPRGLKIGR